MIIFFAPFPALSDEKDGMIQRIASIDSLVSDLPRIYLDLSYRGFLSKRIHQFGNVTVFQLNCFVHFFFIVSLLKKAKIVYIHSVFNALTALIAYFVTKPITDLHGVVPEELEYQGHHRRARLYGFIERIALKRSSSVVYVTKVMMRHFKKKYERLSSSDRIIAILPKLSDERGARENVLGIIRDANAVVYAGGLQAWQNVSLMINVAATAPQFRFEFLSGEAQSLQKLAESANVANFICTSVEPQQVPNHYLTCTYGFILRDAVLVNQVACPTKLVEYLYWGVIPIVLMPDIGDFDALGFSYVSLMNFQLGKMPDADEASRMRLVNRQVVEGLMKSSDWEISKLRHSLRS